MRIYSMTATFGKLEHETLTLKPGLNVIQAPNEWGKSTWCAFLLAMLYGIDGRSRSSKNGLSDRERYAPWSGSPMSGSIELNWQGRDITIERSTKGRIPLGEFCAFETISGLPVPELQAETCGQQLLGVEKSVFVRAGFIRMTDMQVSEDEALRDRLNQLVTTGDESGDAASLESGLKEFKNRCQGRKNGLIPEAQAQRDYLETKLQEYEAMQTQCDALDIRIRENQTRLMQLENHRNRLAYLRAQEDDRAVAQAQQQLDDALARQASLQKQCEGLPTQQEIQQRLMQLRGTQEALTQARKAMSTLTQEPVAPVTFGGLSASEASAQVEKDVAEYAKARSPIWLLILILGVVNVLGGCFLSFVLEKLILGIPVMIVGAVGLWLGLTIRISQSRIRAALEKRYGSGDTVRWETAVRKYTEAWSRYDRQKMQYDLELAEKQSRISDLSQRLAQLQEQQSAEGMLTASRSWEALEAVNREVSQAGENLEVLKTMARSARPTVSEDSLDYDAEQTEQLLEEARTQKQRLISRRGQYAERMEALGPWESLQDQLTQWEKKLDYLNRLYAAAVLAQQTLDAAKQELQRRFSPQITQRAGELMGRMTGSRYDRFTMDQQFRLRAAAVGEDTMHDVLWRSDGTVDQLYLALRLAVAEALCSNAPLILDDALVRFDDTRLGAVLDILKEMGRSRQILLFTCQNRESQCL